MDYARRTPWHNLYNTQPIASFQQDPTILSLTGPAYRCRVSLFLFSVLFLHTPEHQPPTLPGSAWMARNCHDWWWHTENANHELAVTLSLTSKHKTRVSRIFQPSKRSGSVRKPSFSVYYFVSLSHLFTLPWLGTDWWWRTLWEPSRTPKMSTPAAGPLAHDTERSQQAAFFFSFRSGSHNQPSFFVFLCFCFSLWHLPSMNHPTVLLLLRCTQRRGRRLDSCERTKQAVKPS